jgi:hypothetical protein
MQKVTAGNGHSLLLSSLTMTEVYHTFLKVHHAAKEKQLDKLG